MNNVVQVLEPAHWGGVQNATEMAVNLQKWMSPPTPTLAVIFSTISSSSRSRGGEEAERGRGKHWLYVSCYWGFVS